MISVRLSKLEDMKLYFLWANDSVVRENAFNSGPISWEVHQQWYTDKLEDNNACLCIIEENGVPIGQVRFDTKGHDSEIGYSIAEEFRGKGYGQKSLRSAIDMFVNRWVEVTTLSAKVKTQNVASNMIFVGLGFDIQGQEKNTNVVEYRLHLDGNK